MSLLLVLAGLFPPSKNLIWNENLNWQPIPYNSYEVDKELSSGKICTNFKKTFKKLQKTDEMKKRITVYKDVFEFLSNKTGIVVKSLKDVADIYGELVVQRAYGYPLEEWTRKYYPKMEKITLDLFYLYTNTTELRKIIGGFLLRKIINDTENLIKDPSSQTKMHLYSAHEKNMATFLLTLDIFDHKLPAFGSYLLIEVHKINDVYGLKFLHQNYQEREPILRTIPGCRELCPFDKFKELTEKYIPKDKDCVLE